MKVNEAAITKSVNPHQVSASGQETAGNADKYRKTLELFSAAWSRGMWTPCSA